MDDSDWNLFDDLIVRPEISLFTNEIENGIPIALKEINIPDHVSFQKKDQCSTSNTYYYIKK